MINEIHPWERYILGGLVQEDPSRVWRAGGVQEWNGWWKHLRLRDQVHAGPGRKYGMPKGPYLVGHGIPEKIPNTPWKMPSTPGSLPGPANLDRYQ